MPVIRFPRNVCVPLEYAPPLPRQRVFYLGIVYTGPALCQEVTRLYLKRHGNKNVTRKWSLITYEKYDEYDQREYSIELVQKLIDNGFYNEVFVIPDIENTNFFGGYIHKRKTYKKRMKKCRTN